MFTELAGYSALASDDAAREEDLRACTTLYLEEEARAEALVRNLGAFSRFLQLAALEPGNISHFRGLAQELGVPHTTVAGYYEILEDCLIAERIEPFSESRTRKKLTKSPRYLFFDLGVRRAAAEEGAHLPVRVLGALFEQFLGLELLRASRQAGALVHLQFWRDPDGPEVDWVLVSEDRWLPVEVKWGEVPSARDAAHLATFLAEYPKAKEGFVICRTPPPPKLRRCRGRKFPLWSSASHECQHRATQAGRHPVHGHTPSSPFQSCSLQFRSAISILHPCGNVWPKRGCTNCGSSFPAVLILGARQVGKTTLARTAFSKAAYCDLEDPALRHLFTEEPAFQLERRDNAEGLILDEAQSVPSVFAALRGFIDRDRKRNGRFLLLGSAYPSLIRQVSESLAGRVGILDLDPFTVSEVAGKSPRRTLHDLWLRGGFPDAFAGNFREWWEAYLRTYVERDLSQLGVGAEPILLRRLLTMLAHCQGGLLNLSQLGQSLGVSYHTVDRYVKVLEQTFLVRRLPPYHRNVGKRLVKAAKVYLRDTCLLHHLLNLSTLAELEDHPVRGASWETFVIEDVIRREKLASPQSQFFFWRTAAGAEIDLVIERGPQRFGFEIKAGSGEKMVYAHKLAAALTDVGASYGWVLDQSAGVTPLLPSVECRGFAGAFDWLPEGPSVPTRRAKKNEIAFHSNAGNPG